MLLKHLMFIEILISRIINNYRSHKRQIQNPHVKLAAIQVKQDNLFLF
jgi:hypothetical protein